MFTDRELKFVRSLRSKLKSYEHGQLLSEHRFIAVLQVFRYAPWHAARRKLRSEDSGTKVVLMTPKLARLSAQRAGLDELMSVFAVAPTAVVASNSYDQVAETIKKAKKLMPEAFLVAGKVDRTIISGPQWQRLADGPNELETRVNLLKVLAQRPAVVDILDNQSRRVVSVLKRPTVGLATVLENASKSENGEGAAAS